MTPLSKRAWDKWGDVAKVPLGAAVGASWVVAGSPEDPGQPVERVLGEHRGQRLAVGAHLTSRALPLCSSSGFQIADLDEKTLVIVAFGLPLWAERWGKVSRSWTKASRSFILSLTR